MLTGQDLALRLRRAYLTMHRRANAVFAAHGATADQFVLLALLAQEDGVTQQELAERSSSDPNTVRAMLLILETHRWVRRDRHPTDGRARCVSLTPLGRRAHERLVAAANEFHEELLGAVAPAERTVVLSALDRLRAGPGDSFDPTEETAHEFDPNRTPVTGRARPAERVRRCPIPAAEG